MKKSLFSSFFIVLILVVSGTFLLIFGSLFLVHLSNRNATFTPTEPLLFSELVRQSEDPVGKVRDLNKIAHGRGLFAFDVVNENGQSLITHQINPHWTEVIGDLPSREGVLGTGTRSYGPLHTFVTLIRPQPKMYFVTAPRHAPRHVPRHGPPWTLLVSLITSILTSAFLGSAIFLIGFRSKAKQARDVITRLQHGDLKARFPVSKVDEIGELLLAFNKMADEIERLVQELKREGLNQTHLLQDLAHDLRTPLASLHNMLESLEAKKLSDADRDELVNLCLKEVGFTSRLVEDLLLLAQLMEPRYQKASNDVDINDIISDEIESAKIRFPELKVLSRLQAPDRRWVVGNQQLLMRLIRNALENAFEYAKTEVHIASFENEGQFVIELTDDGPGFTAEQIAGFGVKRESRYLTTTEKNKKVSVGLGSVIMRSIVEQHGGHIEVSNDSQAGGAKVRIFLPLER